MFGLETEYGVSFTVDGERRLGPDEVARRMFRDLVAWGRTSNVFLENGARLYLDVGSHPEYATPECDSPLEAVVHERAGDRIVHDLADRTEAALAAEGVRGTLRVFRNNTDSAGNSYGSHENYLVERTGDFGRLTAALLPFLVTRQVFAGAGKLLRGPGGASYVLSQRAEHVWEGVSSATTRSRPLINTRDEPHADAERYRRLHVIVGDSNMSDYACWLRLATTDLVVRMLEEGVPPPVADLVDPAAAVRDVSRDLRCLGRVRLASGADPSALDVQEEYLGAVERFVMAHHPDDELARHALAEWRFVLATLRVDPMRLDRQLDWVAKLRLLEAYGARHDLPREDPRLAMVDLAYHDVHPSRGLHHLLVREGRMQRLVADAAVLTATTVPPSRTRAALRGRFLTAARAAGRDVTVDWVHLKLNEQAQRTVLCKDPLAWQDERVDRLIDAL